MRALAAVGILMILAACQAPPPEMSEAEISQIQSEVEQVAHDWIANWGDVDTCEIATGFVHPEYISISRAGVFARSLDEQRGNCELNRANRESVTANWTSTNVRVISANAAVFTGNWEGTFHYRDGTPARHYAHSATTILFERMDTGWGITFLVTTNDSPQPVSEEG
jgi:hypothetical protein